MTIRHFFDFLVLLVFVLGAFAALVASFILTLLLCTTVVNADMTERDWWSNDTEVSEAELIDHLRDPSAEGRCHAAAMLADRWDGPRYVKLLREDWQAGMEALAGGWPAKDSGPLVLYLLTVNRSDPTENEDAAYSIARHCRGDSIAGHTGPIRDIALRLWCERWATTIPQSIAFPGPIWFASAASRGWLREFFYADAPWCEAWGLSRYSPTPWRLREYRTVLRLFSGDPISPALASYITNNAFLTALKASLATGNCAADIPMADKGDARDDLLCATTFYSEIGTLTYAELLCIVCDRADWVAAVQNRLKTTEHTFTIAEFDVFDPSKIVKVAKTVVEDRHTSLITLLAAAKQADFDAVILLYDDYLHRKWPEYESHGIPNQVWLTHPWMRNAAKSPAFARRWAEIDKEIEWSAFNDGSE